MPTTKELFDSLSSFDDGKVAPLGKPDKGMSLKEKFRSLHQWQPVSSSPPQPDMPIATPAPPVLTPRPLPLYSIFEPSAVGEATKNLLRGFLHSVENTGQVLREGRTSEQAQAFERMTPEEKALYRESGRGLQSPFSQPFEEMQPQNQALMEAAMMGALLGKPLPTPGLPIRGLRPKSKIIPGEPYSITPEGFVESMKRPPRLAPPLPPVPPAKSSQKPATPPVVDEVAQNTANTLRAERIGEQLTQAERIRQSPAGATLLNRDLARQQAEGQLRGLSGEAFPPPTPPPPPPLPPARGLKALPPAPPLAVTPQGQIVPRMARVRGTEATPENLVPAQSSVVGTPRPPDPLIARLGKTRVDTIFKTRLVRAAELQQTSLPDFIAKNHLTLVDESNRPFVNLIADLETRGKSTTGLVKDGKQTSLGPYQISAKVRKELNLSDTATLQEQTQAAERLVSRFRRQYGDDLQMVQLAYNNPARARLLARQVGRTPPRPTEAPLAPPPVVQAVPKTAKGAKAPAVPPPLEPPLAPDVSTRMRELQYEAEHASGQPYGKQYGSVETEMGPQSVAIGNAGSFQEQFAPLYPELRKLPKVGPKEIATAIQKDKNNKLYTIIKDEVSRQLENEKVSPAAIGQRPSDFEVFSRYVDELAAQEKASVKPPLPTQPKLFQTQAEIPPTPLQPKAPQVEHGRLLEGLTPEAPTKQVGLPLSTGESTVGSARYKPPPYTAEQLRTGPSTTVSPSPATGLPPEISPITLRVAARPGFERLANQLELLWQGKLPNPDARFFRNVGAAIKRQDIEFPGQQEILAEHGINHTQLGDAMMAEATQSGQILNIHSQLSKRVQRFARDNPEVAEMMNVIPPPPKKVGWFRKLENTRTAMITGTVRNAMRNAEGGLAATFLDAMEQGVANIAVGARKGKMAQEIAGGMEQFSTILKAMKPGQQQQFLKVLDDFPLEKLDLLSTPVQDVMMKGMGMEKVIGWAQFLNRTQEMWVRGLAFSGSVRGEMIRRGIPLTTPSKNIPADIIEKGIADALRVTSAARPERGTVPGSISSRILELYHAAPILRLVNPFPRFQYANAFRFLWEHSPFGPLDLLTKGQLAKQTTVRMPMVKHLAAKFVKEHGRQPGPEELQRFYAAATKPTPQALKTQQELQNPKTAALALTKSATGLGMLALALAYRSSDDAPSKWYEVNAPQFVPGLGGKTISGEAFAPFITFNLFAEGIRAAVAAYGTQEMKETFNVIKKPPVVEQKDIARAVIGLNRVAGTGLVFIDLLEKGGGWPRVMDFFNQYVGSFTVPLSSVKNLMAGVRPKEAVIRDVKTATPLTGPARRNIPFLGSETLPSSPSITRGQPRRMENPVSGELTGLTKKTYTRLEHEVNRLGLPWYELRPRTGIPEADLYMQRVVGRIMDQPYIEAKILSPDFQRQPNLEKERRLRGYFSSARAVALQQLQAEKPALYQQVWKKKNQSKLDWIQSFQPPHPPR